jgi:OOP family OmpA-OmpF porin
MKKAIISLSFAAMTLFATDNMDIGIGLGRNALSNSPIENYNFFNIRIGKYLPKNHILRFELEKSEDILNNSEDITRFLLNIEHYFKINTTKLIPYVFIGGGYQKVSGNYNDNMVADLGVGGKYKVYNNLNAFAEFRFLRDFGNNDNHYGLLVGVLYKFGSENKKTIQKEHLDSDGDGVFDENDKCPNTIKGVKVDKNGCPLDSDGDGVYDNLDKCPNTPAGVSVDVNGCAVDNDKDGVPDYKDKCLHTEKGFKVNKFGCPVEYKLQVNFKYNSADLTQNSYNEIKKFAEFLKANPKYKVEIQGYTDNKGSEKYNENLSRKRAKTVYNALISLGISKDRLSYKGYGESNPIASNSTEEGRAKNRRVIAKLFY